MKRFSIVLLFVLTTALPMMAQVDFGVRAGAAYSSMVQKVDGRAESNARFGYSLAVISDIYLWNEFSLRPEVVFTQQGGGFLYKPIPSGGLIGGEIPGTGFEEYRYNSIQVPVNICYTFKLSDVDVNLLGGPYVDFSLFGKKKFGDWKDNINFGTRANDDLRPFDVGLNIGIGAEYANVICSIRAACGFLDRRADKVSEQSAVYQNSVTFSIGYYFRN